MFFLILLKREHSLADTLAFSLLLHSGGKRWGRGCTFSGGEAGKTPGLGVAVVLFWLNLQDISDYNPLHKYTCQKIFK